MTPETKIQLAADFIRGEFDKRGSVISEADALTAARKLHTAWERQADIETIGNLPAGEIARRFRDRYLTNLPVAIIETPLSEFKASDIFGPGKCKYGNCSVYRNRNGGCDICGSPCL